MPAGDGTGLMDVGLMTGWARPTGSAVALPWHRRIEERREE
jgi:hypothetical protein